MVLRINTNIAALTANRHLGVNDLRMSKTFERLSSGLRINRSADDAAGLAISEKMGTQTRGIHRAIRNAQMGINYIQTAEGGVSELENMVQRIRELVIQAANDTNTRSDREKIQLEINALLEEFDRLPLNTSFNQNLPLQIPPEILAKLDPPPGGPADISYVIDVSASMGPPIANVASNLTSFIGVLNSNNIDFRISVTAITGAASGGDGVRLDLDASSTQATIQSAIDNLTNLSGGRIDTLNALLETAGATMSASEAATLGFAAGQSYDLDGNETITRRSGVSYFQILVADTGAERQDRGALTTNVDAAVTGDEDYTDNFGGGGHGTAMNDSDRYADVGAILARHDTTVYVVGDAPASGGIFEANATSGGTYAPITSRTNGTTSNNLAGAFANDLTQIATNIASSVTNPENFVVDKGGIQVMIGANEGQLIGIDRFHVNRTRIGLRTVNVERFSDFEDTFIGDSASATIAFGNLESDIFGQIDTALERLATMRAHYGAAQNRLEYAVSNLSITNENLTASRSRILDTDYASETANLTRLQILQQAGTAVVSQANVAPQTALSLLG